MVVCLLIPTDRQLDDIELEKIFEEKASAKDADRPVLQDCIDYLRAGDCLHVHSIDRLARNMMDLQKIVTDLNSKSISVTFHKEDLTFTGNGDSPMSKLMLQMMGSFAEFERSLINERQREGIAKAQQKGVRFGLSSMMIRLKRLKAVLLVVRLNLHWLKNMGSVGKLSILLWLVDHF